MAGGSLSFLVRTLGARASVTQRFWLIAIVALAPMAFVSALLWREAEADLARLRGERAGVEYARPVWRVLHGAGQTGHVDASRLAVLGDAAAAHDRKFGAAAQSAAVRRLVRDNAPDAQVAGAALRLMERIGDRSGLYLDDNAATYHHMRLTVADLPEAAAAIAAANVLLDPGAARANASPGVAFAHVKFTLERAERSAGAALAATDDPRARARLAAAQSQLRADVARHDEIARLWFRQRLEALDRNRPDERPSASGALRLQHERALQTAEALWSAAAQDLARALIAREDARRAAATGAVLAVLLAIGLIAGTIWLLSRSVLKPWSALMDATGAVAAGDIAAHVPCQDYANEIGEAARALELFRIAIAERAMLADDLARERDDLEARVGARTGELEAARGAAQESEQLLSQALQSIRAGAWSIDPATQSVWSSPQIADICGKPFRVDDFHDGVWDLVREPQASELKRQPPDPATGLRCLSRDLQIVRPDGAVRWIHCTAVRLSDDRAVGLLMDVTVRKMQELELAEARRRAEDGNTAKSRFIAAMSHEIRTPLNGVLAMAAALERTPLVADQRRMLDLVLGSARQLLAMLDDVLDVSKIEAGSLVLHEQPFDLAANVEAVASLFREAAREKCLLLSVEIAPGARGLWRGDALRIRQVLQNFVSNSVKFTARGGIVVRARGCASGLRLEVEDTGIGIGRTQAQGLFQRFVQADGSITRRYGGTGLGLAICRELAELMGGEVGVESSPGAGALFWFEAPLARAEKIEAIACGARRVRILAAEDNAGNRAVLDTLLAQAALDADFVEDGAQAVEATLLAAYDLILMDLHMPHLDGIGAARAIRAGGGPNAATPILALSASADTQALAACRAAGMAGHVSKPIAPAALYAAIAAALEPHGEPLALPATAS